MGEFYQKFRQRLEYYFQTEGIFDEARTKLVHEIIEDKEKVIEEFEQEVKAGKRPIQEITDPILRKRLGRKKCQGG